MTDEQLKAAYTAGLAKSHEAGLRAVFDAGVASLGERIAALEKGLVVVEPEPEKVVAEDHPRRSRR
jgi:hypothetical protein